MTLQNEELGMKSEKWSLGPGSYIKLTVKDSGEGMAPDIKEKIFDPYFTTKEVGEGIGMGMAIFYGHVTKYNGEIYIESEIGKGTVVEVLFPKFQEEVPSANRKRSMRISRTALSLLTSSESLWDLSDWKRFQAQQYRTP